ncbi:MAG: hypothetical protein GY854_25645 [Deltaproteobacteria bacterium]|nr:hypothetical protein [Deltaproteobacteria bacterium]
MDHRGHPKKPLKRNELLLQNLTENFLAETGEEDPVLTRRLEPLDVQGRNELGGILGRFDLRNKGVLDARQRLLARRVLTRLHRHNNESLALTNKILDYLDLNHNALLEEDELELCVEIMEFFGRADSDNHTMSQIELEMLYAVLRHIDSNSNGKLDPHERDQLHRGLQDPEAFLADQKVRNPLLSDVLANR